MILTNDPGLGTAGNFRRWPPVFAAGALPHCCWVLTFSFEVLPLPQVGRSSLLDLVVFSSVFAVFVFSGAFRIVLLTAAAGFQRRLAAGFMLIGYWLLLVIPL